jgi:two-component system LytT family response regulator
MVNELRALIVDDERLARRELRAMLGTHSDVVVVGEADSVSSAVAQIDREDPDVVFLDIQLGGESGFHLLDEMNRNLPIIFVTAYEEHAVRAFEANALDYLLKPVSKDRLADALDKVKRPRPTNDQSQGRLEYDDRMFVSLEGRMAFLRIDSIKYISAQRDHSYVHTRDGRQRRVNKSLKEWENRLPETHFLRIHRSTIVSMDCVKRLEPWSNFTYLVYIEDTEEPLAMSRRYAAKAKKRLG